MVYYSLNKSELKIFLDRRDIDKHDILRRGVRIRPGVVLFSGLIIRLNLLR